MLVGLMLAQIIKVFMVKNIDYKLMIDDRYIYYCKSHAKRQGSKILSMHRRSEIEILVYNPGYIFDKYLDGNGKVVRGGNISVSPYLYLHCSNAVKYHLPSRLSQTEFWWVGQELSDFLNLELQVIYPTPELSSPD
jgi:hypothetical protein